MASKMKKCSMNTFEMIKNSENHTSLIDILEFFALATKSVIED